METNSNGGKKVGAAEVSLLFGEVELMETIVRLRVAIAPSE